MDRWQDKARLVIVTATVTSVVWLVAAALWFGGQGDHRPAMLAGPAMQSSPPKPHSPSPVSPSAVEAMLIPVRGVPADQLVDTFAQARAGGSRIHDAIDIMAPSGTPVLAAVGGRVEKLFTSQEGGQTIYIRTRDGRTMTYYAHLSAYAPGLVEGRQVQAGEVIGAVGATGNADPAASHLHFAVFATMPQARWDEGKPINPYPLLRTGP